MESLDEALRDLAELGPRATERFSAAIDQAWIQEALTSTGSASVRRRKIPADAVVWMVLGMALFRDRSIDEVVDHLGLVLPDKDGVKGCVRSAIVQSRYRVGPAALSQLFRTTADAWHAKVKRDGYRGLSLHAVDGTCMRVQDSDANFRHFGKPGGRGGSNDAGYPQLRLACLLSLDDRLIRDVSFGPFATSEKELAERLWPQLPAKSLTIVDRGFNDYETWASLADRGDERHLLVRLKANVKPDIVELLPDGSALVCVRPSTNAKAKDSKVRPEIRARIVAYQNPDGEPCRLLTTLVDHETYPAKELVELYHQRWEIEIAFDELKTHMLERLECIRSLKAEGVEQELWGILLMYNLVRFEMAQAAVVFDVDPNRMSFRHSLILLRIFWETTAWSSSPSKIPMRLAELRDRFQLLVLPPRRSERRYPRHVKIKMSNYDRNRGKRPLAATTELVK